MLNYGKNISKIMLSYADENDIKYKPNDSKNWELCHRDNEDCNKCNYLIKQESTYRPFKDKEECWNEMQKHQPFGWICNVHNVLIIGVEVDHPEPGIIIAASSCDEFKDLEYMNVSYAFKHYTFIDGTPFGIKEG